LLLVVYITSDGNATETIASNERFRSDAPCMIEQGFAVQLPEKGTKHCIALAVWKMQLNAASADSDAVDL